MSAIRMYILQRTTAALMVPMIVVHVFVIFHATDNGLSAQEILARTSGSFGWATFYGLFVLLASVHAAIGVRSVAKDWLRATPIAQSILMWGVGLSLLATGVRAVMAVVFPGTA